MSLQYIIDGCNIIHHPLFLRENNKKIPDKRVALLELINIRKLSGSPRNRVTVVFDGFCGQELMLNLGSVRQDITVIFSGKETADEWIRKTVESSTSCASTVLVSDDKEIQFMSRLFRAKFLGVEEFLSSRKDKGKKSKDAEESGISFTEKERINRELRKLWLK
jgi:predicted RNA-binding protein with PIN domain